MWIFLQVAALLPGECGALVQLRIVQQVGSRPMWSDHVIGDVAVSGHGTLPKGLAADGVVERLIPGLKQLLTALPGGQFRVTCRLALLWHGARLA